MPLSREGFSSLRIWEYQDTAKPVRAVTASPPARLTAPVAAPVLFTQEQVSAQILVAIGEAEARWMADTAAKESDRRAQVSNTLDALEAQRNASLKAMEVEVVQFALAIARKILQREAQLDPERLQALVRRALDRMGATHVVQVHVPPEAAERWQAHSPSVESAYTWEIVPDSTLQEGDCVVHSSLGHANFGFESQFQQIEEDLSDVVGVRLRSQASVERHDVQHSAKDIDVLASGATR